VDMLLTTFCFVVLTAIAVRSHLRAKNKSAGSARAKALGGSCPRCRAVVPEGAQTCAACGVPLGAFEIVGAAAVQSSAGDEGAAASLHAVVKGDLCVGCGLCVPVCPEPGAIVMSGHRAIVDLNLCKGHGKCVEACPVGGIFLTSGEAAQRVEVPQLDIHFQSNVPGLYIVGELGGRGLIKNAVNEGRIAIEFIAAEVRAERASRPPIDDGVLDVLIVGAGPAGLSAGLEAKRSELAYVVLERGTVADTIRKYPRHKLLLAEPVKMPLYGDLWIADASKESLIHVWEAIVEETKLDVLTGHEVTRVVKNGRSFEVEAADMVFRTRRVVLAMGRRGIPRKLDVRGEDLCKVVYDVAEMEVFKGRRVLVVGGGDSAVETALGLANQPGTDVTLSYRGEKFARVKDRNTAKLKDAVEAGLVRLMLQSQVKAISEDKVEIAFEGAVQTLPNDDVIVRIGGVPPKAFLDSAGVATVRKDIPMPSPTEESPAG